MKKTVLIFSLLILPSLASADIQTRIDSECGEAEPIISISDPYKLYSHAAEPGYYGEQLCVSGISESSIQENRCQLSTGFYLTDRGDNAHFSIYSAYRLNVCTGEMDTRITSPLGSCNSRETALFSVSGRDNAHVAAPSVFDRVVCGSYIEPENVTVSMEFNLTSSDEVYFDGERVENEEQFSSAEYPALVSEGEEMVSGLVVSDMKEASRQLDGRNVLSIKTNPNASSYLVPFTTGDIDDIEQSEEQILNNRFLSQTRPSFAPLDADTSPNVRVVYSPGIEVESNISFSPGTHEFTITKTGENTVKIH